MLDTLKNFNKVVGVKQSLKALEKNCVKTAYIAKDADLKVLGSIIELCNINEVEIVDVDSMKNLGRACGIEVGASVVCIVDSEK